MKIVVIDASVWVSALIAKDGHHAVSQTWIDDWQRQGNTFAGPETFLTEVGCAVGRDSSRAGMARLAVSNILSSPRFELVAVDRQLAEEAADLGIQARFRGADALYVAVAKRLRVPIVTWDNEILDRASDVGVDARVPTV